jgi:CRP/FNR family transcriptional regulator, cyclic AMP receptor protein
MIPEVFSKAEGPGRKLLKFQRGEFIFRQGDPVDGIYFVVSGRVRLSVTDFRGKQATLALLGPHELFGEQCLILGAKTRMMTTRAVAVTEAVKVARETITARLEHDAQLARFVLRDLVARMVRYEEALVHQIINNSERRLARALLRLAEYDGKGAKSKVIEGVSHEVLAEIIGASRPRISGFMNKFRRLGYIEYSGNRIVVKPSLVAVLFQQRASRRVADPSGHDDL